MSCRALAPRRRVPASCGQARWLPLVATTSTVRTEKTRVCGASSVSRNIRTLAIRLLHLAGAEPPASPSIQSLTSGARQVGFGQRPPTGCPTLRTLTPLDRRDRALRTWHRGGQRRASWPPPAVASGPHPLHPAHARRLVRRKKTRMEKNSSVALFAGIWGVSGTNPTSSGGSLLWSARSRIRAIGGHCAGSVGAREGSG
jgi:hypothetical protein